MNHASRTILEAANRVEPLYRTGSKVWIIDTVTAILASRGVQIKLEGYEG